MKGYYLGAKPLNILSCAVAGRPGRSAYDTAVAGGYEGTAEAYAAFLAALPGALTRLNTYNGRVDAILEYMGNQIADLELAVGDLQSRVAALEQAGGGTP